MPNATGSPEFHLTGLTADPELRSVLLGLLLCLYFITVFGNLLVIITISSDHHLHTPMYFFLCNLSLADICFISTIVPKLAIDIHTHNRVISFMGCLTQMSLFILSVSMDDLLLTVMAYDYFVAICHPLNYSVIMNSRLCCFLVLLSFWVSILVSLLNVLIVLQVTCFKGISISNFFCDSSQLLNLTYSDTFSQNIVTYVFGVMFGFFPMTGILCAYYRIVSSTLKIPPLGGRCKVFSTCGSHLSVVCLFYGTAIGVDLGSSVLHSPRSSVLASVMYTMVTPMLNPFIYTLKNKDISNSLKRLQNWTL